METATTASLENATWWLIVTALAIPVGSAIFAGILGLFGAHVGKNATRYAANLQAAQRRHDLEIARLERARDDLMAAATAAQSYAWYVKKSVRLQVKISTQEWQEALPFIEPAVKGAQRLLAVAATLPTESLRNVYVEVEELIMAIVQGSDDGKTDPWEKYTEEQPTAFDKALDATAAEIKRLYDTYPDGSNATN